MAKASTSKLKIKDVIQYIISKINFLAAIHGLGAPCHNNFSLGCKYLEMMRKSLSIVHFIIVRFAGSQGSGSWSFQGVSYWQLVRPYQIVCDLL